MTQQPKAHAVTVMVSRPKEVWTDLAHTAFLTKGVVHSTASKGQTPYGRTFMGRDGTTHAKEPLIQCDGFGVLESPIRCSFLGPEIHMPLWSKRDPAAMTTADRANVADYDCLSSYRFDLRTCRIFPRFPLKCYPLFSRRLHSLRSAIPPTAPRSKTGKLWFSPARPKTS